MTTDQIGFQQPSTVKVNLLQRVFSQWFLTWFPAQVKYFACPNIYLSIYLPSFLPFLISSSFLLSLLFLLFSFSFILSCYLSVSFLLSLLSLFSHYFPQHPDPAQLWAIATNKNWKQWPVVAFDGHQKSVSQTQKQVRNTQFGEWYCLLWTGFASNFSEETEEVTSNYLFPMLASGLPWTLWSIQNTGCGVVLARCRITYCVSEIYTQ